MRGPSETAKRPNDFRQILQSQVPEPTDQLPLERWLRDGPDYLPCEGLPIPALVLPSVHRLSLQRPRQDDLQPDLEETRDLRRSHEGKHDETLQS